AVEAMRLGARDYVEKPWQNARLLTTLETQLALGHALEEGRRLRAERQHREASERPAMVAESRAMQEVLDLLQRVAPSDANVLVTGEHGTGKEVVARYLHAASTRHDEPFVVVHAGALADGVFESELFGHVRGAFTDAKADKPGCFALAHGGTLFLDEIGTMPLSQQAKLLRVLQSGELTPVGSTKVQRVDVRVVAATNVDVASAVERGDFREDLLYRLNTIEVRLPPLRDRRADIAPLAERFLARAPRPLRFSPDALEALAAHAWPGNVRELEHTIERAALLARGDCIEVEDLSLTSRRRNAERLDDMTLLEAEAHLIRRALERHGGQVVAAAKALGLSRSALYRRMSQHGIKAP
ncbi:MAG: sigma-54-dependent Fis family transcriptional regulator, partial [Myxococcales bacterium]|nr:sigma-54-dependent Fis family transcriptional regulator [Myxococcales bacterium]